jgi:hypothetical protein
MTDRDAHELQPHEQCIRYKHQEEQHVECGVRGITLDAAAAERRRLRNGGGQVIAAAFGCVPRHVP